MVISDLDQERVDRGAGYVHGEIDKLLAKKRISPDEAQPAARRWSAAPSTWPRTPDCDFVIEAVFEELEVKQQVFAELEKHVGRRACWPRTPPRCRSPRWPTGSTHPERVVGFHFFNPVAVLPLLEVVRARRPTTPTLATALAVAKALKKNAVLVEGRAGVRGEPAADPAAWAR